MTRLYSKVFSAMSLPECFSDPVSTKYSSLTVTSLIRNEFWGKQALQWYFKHFVRNWVPLATLFYTCRIGFKGVLLCMERFLSMEDNFFCLNSILGCNRRWVRCVLWSEILPRMKMLYWNQAVGLDPTTRSGAYPPLQPIKSWWWVLGELWRQNTMWHKGHYGGKESDEISPLSSSALELFHLLEVPLVKMSWVQFQLHFLSFCSLLWYFAYKALPPIKLLQSKGCCWKRWERSVRLYL